MQFMIKLGQTDEGERVAVEFRIEEKRSPSGRMTVDHDVVRDYTTFAMSGEMIGGKYRGERYGQCQEEIREAVFVEEFVPAEVRNRLLDLWDRWHLNDMKAGCQHQFPVRHDRDDWRAGAAFQTSLCPEHYAYGSAWLIEVIPDHVLTELYNLAKTYGYSLDKQDYFG